MLILTLLQLDEDQAVREATLVSLSWQTVDAARGQSGNRGQIEALRLLNEHEVDLSRIDLRGYYLKGVELTNAKLEEADFGCGALRSNTSGAILVDADLRGARLKGAKFHSANLLLTSLVP